MNLTLGQAAKHAKRAKGTLSNALKSGALSGEKIIKNGREAWQIEPAELKRWMDFNPIQVSKEFQNTTHNKNEENHLKTNELLAKLEVAEKRCADLEKSSAEAAVQAGKTIDDLRTRLDQESEERRKLTAMLTDQRMRRKGFWARLVGAYC